jgi:AcrR family transcriptional regulator
VRISKEQKQKNIEAVFKATIKLSAKTDFDSLTMKAIAKEAKIGEATIYNYFPKKENLITGFFDWTIEKAIEKTEQDSLGDMTFTEVLHTLIENHLEILTPSKDFFAHSMTSLFVNPLSLANTSVSATKARYIEFITAKFKESLKKGTVQAPPFQEFILALLWDFHIGILYYWLKDDKSSAMRTTELIDLSMKVFEEVLKTDLFNKVYAVAHFLFKEHLLNKLLNPIRLK